MSADFHCDFDILETFANDLSMQNKRNKVTLQYFLNARPWQRCPMTLKYIGLKILFYYLRNKYVLKFNMSQNFNKILIEFE